MELQHQSFSDGKRFACSRDPGSIPGLERSPGEGNGNPLQYFCLENSVEGRAWTATVHVDVTAFADTVFREVIKVKGSCMGWP